MIPDWQTNQLFLSDLLDRRFPDVPSQLRSVLHNVPIDPIAGTSDIWCRNFMPIQVASSHYCQFVYDPDYLQDFKQLITPAEQCRLPLMKGCRQESIILDGGNVVASRTKVILTDKGYKENPSIDRPKLRKRLGELFNAECIFIPKEPYDTTGYSDGVVRFIDENRVFINDYSSIDPAYGVRPKKGSEQLNAKAFRGDLTFRDHLSELRTNSSDLLAPFFLI